MSSWSSFKNDKAIVDKWRSFLQERQYSQEEIDNFSKEELSPVLRTYAEASPEERQRILTKLNKYILMLKNKGVPEEAVAAAIEDAEEEIAADADATDTATDTATDAPAGDTSAPVQQPGSADDPTPMEPKSAKSSIKYSLPDENDLETQLQERNREIYFNLKNIHSKKYPKKDFKKDLNRFVELLGPHNPTISVKKLNESNKFGRILKMIAKTNAGERNSKEAYESLSILKRYGADQNSSIYRIVITMLNYKGRDNGNKQIGNDLIQFVGAIMNIARAVDISSKRKQREGVKLSESEMKRWQIIANINKKVQ